MEISICELVRKMEQEDKENTTIIGKYVKFNQREIIETIDAYLNSKHISGEYDSKGREKPFFNIVTAARNIWMRATDIDRKNIKIKATKEAMFVAALVATIKLQEWMRKAGFGMFLNDWGLALASYGSVISKFVEKDGELTCDVMPWNRMIVDPIDFESNPQIEKIWMTPAQLLKNKNYKKDIVDKLLDSLEARETPDGQDKDTKDGYIPIYEIHGELSLAYLTGKESDEHEYTQQMHVVSFLENEETGEWDEYDLYMGREAKSPYTIAHLIKEDGRTLSIGAVEHLFQSQWMQNHNSKNIKDQLDLASKIITQTSDTSFAGRNILNSIEQGDVLTHKMNEPLTRINNQADIQALQSYQQQWKEIGNEIVGTSEAMLGKAAKSGTAWRQTEALLQESHDLFEQMTENKDLYLQDMLTTYIIPFIKKQMDTSEEMSEILEDHQIAQIDARYVPNEVIRRVNDKIKKTILSGKLFTEEQQQEETLIETDNIQNALSSLGNQRFIKPSDIPTKTWKEALKDLEWDLDIDITGEGKDTQAIMTTLTTVLQSLAANPMMLEDPRMKLIFNRIMNEVGGISPVELSTAKPPVSPQMGGSPQGNQVGAGQQPMIQQNEQTR